MTWTGVLVVLVVTDVTVDPFSSAVAEMCEGVSLDSDWEFVEPQPPLSPTSARLFGWRVMKR